MFHSNSHYSARGSLGWVLSPMKKATPLIAVAVMLSMITLTVAPAAATDTDTQAMTADQCPDAAVVEVDCDANVSTEDGVVVDGFATVGVDAAGQGAGAGTGNAAGASTSDPGAFVSGDDTEVGGEVNGNSFGAGAGYGAGNSGLSYGAGAGAGGGVGNISAGAGCGAGGFGPFFGYGCSGSAPIVGNVST
jgi:hypothetical protein